METFILLFAAVAGYLGRYAWFEFRRRRRRNYYRNVYLNSAAWQRKRLLVLRRDNWQWVYCGARATQVHHLKYTKRKIGKEPIAWLVSICFSCHHKIH